MFVVLFTGISTPQEFSDIEAMAKYLEKCFRKNPRGKATIRLIS